LVQIIRTKRFAHGNQFTYSLIGVYRFFPDRLLEPGDQQRRDSWNAFKTVSIELSEQLAETGCE
jgi:hypothetical protein